MKVKEKNAKKKKKRNWAKKKEIGYLKYYLSSFSTFFFSSSYLDLGSISSTCLCSAFTNTNALVLNKLLFHQQYYA